MRDGVSGSTALLGVHVHTGRTDSRDVGEVEFERREEAPVEPRQELHLPGSLQDPSGMEVRSQAGSILDKEKVQTKPQLDPSVHRTPLSRAPGMCASGVSEDVLVSLQDT